MKFTRAMVALLAVSTAAPFLAQEQASLPRLADVTQLALKHPKPPFPKKARAQHIHGWGIFAVEVDFESGQVTDVTVFRSTGSKMLDDSAIETLKRWQFRPHTLFRAKVPIAFTFTKE